MQETARPYDLVIVGASFAGLVAARTAAMRGLSVALIEQGDFAGGTSSKTSKLIHGGLRYLKQGRVHLVFESLRERQVLRTIAPEVVHPLALLLPVYAGDSRASWEVNLGLWLYDLLAGIREAAGGGNVVFSEKASGVDVGAFDAVIAVIGVAMMPSGGKGDSPHLCEAPSGPFRQMGTVPFFPPFHATRRGTTSARGSSSSSAPCPASSR